MCADRDSILLVGYVWHPWLPLEQTQKAPYAVVLGGHKDPKQAFMVIDGKIMCEIPIDDIPIYLIAVFYIFNICYPTGCQNFGSYFA